jgi:hypothetical protein
MGEQAMGEAKKRGTLEERLKQANINQQQILEGLREEYGFPENAKFCGYIVHLPESDEFLADIKITSSSSVRAFAKLPDYAKLFRHQADAEKAAKHCKQKTYVAFLIDIGKQFCVIGLD